MSQWRRITGIGLVVSLATALVGVPAAQDRPQPPEPRIGQPGKDVIWVPSPPELIEKMLDLAQVTPQDFVVDLGSGDGRTVIAAAKRGARALGVEYDGPLAVASRQNVMAAGVGDKATIAQGDMYESDFSQATVLALFLLPTNLLKLRDKFLDLTPGSRIVVNNFEIPDWSFDDTVSLDVCDPWCTAHLWIVPARVGGTWRVQRFSGGGRGVAPPTELTLTQRFQVVAGAVATGAGTTRIASVSLRGADLRFTVGSTEYAGRVSGSVIEGTTTAGGVQSAWRATRVSP